jgi:hypothetical protein
MPRRRLEGRRVRPRRVKLVETAGLFGLSGLGTTRLSGCPDRWLQFVKKYLDAIFLYRISFLEACKGIREAVEYRLGRRRLRKECLVGLQSILSNA